MAHKSHRQKALQSQLEPQPAISLISSAKKAPLAKPTPATSSQVPSSSSNGFTGVADNDAMDEDDEVLISSSSAVPGPSTGAASTSAGPSGSGFEPLSAAAQSSVSKNEFRRVPIPPHRMSPLKRDWVNLYTPMVEMLGLQVRMNVKRRAVEIKVGDVSPGGAGAVGVGFSPRVKAHREETLPGSFLEPAVLSKAKEDKLIRR
jgi:RNA-binding protein PNO1